MVSAPESRLGNQADHGRGANKKGPSETEKDTWHERGVCLRVHKDGIDRTDAINGAVKLSRRANSRLIWAWSVRYVSGVFVSDFFVALQRKPHPRLSLYFRSPQKECVKNWFRFPSRCTEIDTDIPVLLFSLSCLELQLRLLVKNLYMPYIAFISLHAAPSA